jgi:capsular exopolysaccharide synthesis family protein
MSVRDFIRIIRQRALLILAVAAAAGAAAYVFSQRQSPSYRAVSQVLLSYEDLPSFLTNGQNPATAVPPDRYAATEAQVARSPAIARRALAAQREPMTPSELLRSSTVTSDPTSDVLSFVVNAGGSHRAQRLANAYARAFVSDSYATRVAPLHAVQTTLRARLKRMRAQGAAGSPLYTTLRQRYDEVEGLLAVQNPDARVVHPATSATQTRPRTTRALVVGVPVGVLLGIVIALLLHFLDTRVRSGADAGHALGVPSLGTVPLPPRRARHRVLLLDGKGDGYADAVATVRTNLDLERRESGSAALLFASCVDRTPGVKSATVANLGVAFARTGYQVVLVDLDLRQPSLAGLFSLVSPVGVIDVLVGRADVDEALVPIELEPPRSETHLELGGSLRVLPAGAPTANPADVLPAARLGALLEEIRADADLILVDAPPVLAAGDVAAVSHHVDAVTLITHLGHDTRSDLAEARRRLASIHAARLGVVGVGRTRNPTLDDAPPLEAPPPRREGIR